MVPVHPPLRQHRPKLPRLKNQTPRHHRHCRRRSNPVRYGSNRTGILKPMNPLAWIHRFFLVSSAAYPKRHPVALLATAAKHPLQLAPAVPTAREYSAGHPGIHAERDRPATPPAAHKSHSAPACLHAPPPEIAPTPISRASRPHPLDPPDQTTPVPPSAAPSHSHADTKLAGPTESSHDDWPPAHQMSPRPQLPLHSSVTHPYTDAISERLSLQPRL